MPVTHAFRRTMFALVLLLAFAPAAFSAAVPGKLLRFKPNEGGTAVYNHQVSARVELKEQAGQKARSEMSAQTRCSIEFLGPTASGDFGVRGSVDAHQMEVKSDGDEEVQQMPEIAARYVINPQGRIKSISRLSGELDPTSATTGLMMSPDEVFLLGGAAILPDKPVKKGDKWSGSIRVPGSVEGEDEQLKYESVLLGDATYRGIACQQIRTKASVAASASMDVPDGSGRATTYIKATIDATWLFDPERGVIVSVAATDKLSMTVKVSSSDQVIRLFTLSGVINEKGALTEFNGAHLGL